MATQQFIEFPSAGGGGGGGSTVNQGNPAPLSSAWPIKITDGVNSASLLNITNAQLVSSAPGFSLSTAATILGWDGINHTEIAVNALGVVKVVQPDTIVTGTIAGTQNVSLSVNGLSSAGIQVTGTWTGTLTLESSVDGVVFNAASGVPLTGGTITSNLSSNNILQMNVSGMSIIRIRGNTVATGTAIITIRGNATTGPVVLSEPLPNGGNVIGSVGQSGTWTVTSNDAGYIRANAPTRNVYTVTPVTTAAYFQLVAATTLATKEVEIFDSSGQTLVLATGGPAAEVDQIFIFPGGNGRVKFAIPAGSRVSIKAVSATASVGEISVNWYG